MAAKINLDAGTGLAALGMIYQQIISFVSGLLIARVIGAADYGIFNTSRSLLSILLVFTRLGLDFGLQKHLGSATTDAVLQSRLYHLKTFRRLAVMVAIVIVLLTASGGGYLLEKYVFRFDNFGAICLGSMLALPFMTDMALLGGTYRGVLKIGPSIIADLILAPTLRLALVVVFFIIGFRLWGVVIATSAASIVAAIWLQRKFRQDFKSQIPQRSELSTEESRVRKEEISAVVKYSLVLAFSIGVTTLTRTLDSLEIGRAHV